MSEPRPELEAELEAELEEMARLEEEAREGAREDRPSVARLVDAGDVDGLLELAKLYRAGDETTPRDLKKCVEAYEAAASLGSAMAGHAVGVFHMTGGPIARDEAEAASRFRQAADAGYIPSKVYLANLYELGIHYSTDPKKAGVWYRSVARSADIEHDDGSPEYAAAMAELGCVRYCLQLAEDDETSDDDRARFLRKARVHGYRPRRTPTPEPTKPLRIGAGVSTKAPRAASPAPSRKSEPATSENDDTELSADDLAFLEAAVAAEASGDGLMSASEKAEAAASDAELEALLDAREAKGKPGKANPEAKAKAEAKGKADEGKTAATKKKTSARTPLTWGTGFAAFLYASVFMAVAVGAGFGLTAWAESVVAAGESAPVVGQQPVLFLPLLIATVGVLPNLLIYRFRAVGKAIIAAGLFAILGEALWGLGHQLLGHITQVSLFAAAGLVLGLLVLGIGGEARDKSKKKASSKVNES